MNKPVYSMSEAGECPRVLAAQRLGYEPLPQLPADEERLKHYSRCEALAAQQIMDEGYRIEPSSLCLTCWERYGIERYGIHVEIDTPLFLLVGHLDRRLILDDNRRLPVEIKSLGRYSWSRFAKDKFNGFPGYAGREVCYLEAEKSPGVYWVMNRDSGESQKYIVNDFNNEISLDEFKKIVLPITFEEIVDKLNQIEIAVQYNDLPEGEESDACQWCRYKFLCSKPEEKQLKVVDLPPLIEAAQMYKDGLALEKEAKDMKSTATLTLLTHAKQSQIDKYKVSNVSFTYHGFKDKETVFDSGLFKEQQPELYNQYLKAKKAYDDYSIKVLKE